MEANGVNYCLDPGLAGFNDGRAVYPLGVYLFKYTLFEIRDGEYPYAKEMYFVILTISLTISGLFFLSSMFLLFGCLTYFAWCALWSKPKRMALRAASGLPIMLFSNFDNRIADIITSGMKYLALKNPSSYAKPEPIFIHKLEMFTLLVFFLGLGRLIAANVVGVLLVDPNLSLVLQSTALIIDLLFLVEFCARFLYSHQNQGIRDYWFTYHGWLDFLAVIPSLFLFSLPVAVALLTDFYIIDPLPIFTLFLLFKLPRILRAEIMVNLLLKFKKEKESLLSGTSMLGHHTRMILTIVVGSILTFATIADLTFLRKSQVIRDFEAEKKASLFNP